MTTPARATVFLVDVDNTLLDNDHHVQIDDERRILIQPAPPQRERSIA